MSEDGIEEQQEAAQENHVQHNHVDVQAEPEMDPELAALIESKKHKDAEDAEAMREAAASLRAEIEVEEKEIAVLKEKQVPVYPCPSPAEHPSLLAHSLPLHCISK